MLLGRGCSIGWEGLLVSEAGGQKQLALALGDRAVVVVKRRLAF